VQLAKVAPRLLPDISAEHIKDKSKANSLAKAIVVVQASWVVAFLWSNGLCSRYQDGKKKGRTVSKPRRQAKR